LWGTFLKGRWLREGMRREERGEKAYTDNFNALLTNGLSIINTFFYLKSTNF